MQTEQEVIAYLNSNLATINNPASLKLIAKLRSLETILNEQKGKLSDLQKQISNTESDANKTRGAISIILELIAEEEKLINPK